MSNEKQDWHKNVLLIKDPQFSPDQADIQPKLPILELVILVKYQIDQKKIEDFLYIKG